MRRDWKKQDHAKEERGWAVVRADNSIDGLRYAPTYLAALKLREGKFERVVRVRVAALN